MTDQRRADALARIDRALQAIETAAREPRPAPPATDVDDRLLLAHARLREVVEGAVGRLDALIAAETR